MKVVLRGAQVYASQSGFSHMDVLIDNGVIADIAPAIPFCRDIVSFDFHSFFLFPGLVDVHVHLREPGFSYKETIKTVLWRRARWLYHRLRHAEPLSCPRQPGNARPRT